MLLAHAMGSLLAVQALIDSSIAAFEIITSARSGDPISRNVWRAMTCRVPGMPPGWSQSEWETLTHAQRCVISAGETKASIR